MITRYLIERKGNLFFFIPGLCLNLLAVAFNSITYRFAILVICYYSYLRKDQSKETSKVNLLEENTPKVVIYICCNQIGSNKDQCLEVNRHLCCRRFYFLPFFIQSTYGDVLGPVDNSRRSVSSWLQ